MKHTPGPWKYTPHHRNDAQGHIFMENAKGACTIHLTGAASMPQKQLNTNAHLIASAPELLEALYQVLMDVENEIPLYAITANGKKVLNAIKKAKGEG